MADTVVPERQVSAIDLVDGAQLQVRQAHCRVARLSLIDDSWLPTALNQQQ